MQLIRRALLLYELNVSEPDSCMAMADSDMKAIITPHARPRTESP